PHHSHLPTFPTPRSSDLPGAEIEMEHLRAPNRCPIATGMAGVFLWDTPQRRRLDAGDESLKQQASDVVEQNFPECRGKVLFVHRSEEHTSELQSRVDLVC